MTPQLMHAATNPIGTQVLSVHGASWMSSLLCLGGLSAAPFSGSLADKFGRKVFGYVALIPMLLSWLLILFAQNHIHIYVARFIGGIAGTMAIFIVSTYVGEIASESVRGFLGSFLIFSINVGILMAFVAGTYLSFSLFHTLCLVFPVIFGISFFFLPESPVYLMRQNRYSEATR